MSINLVDTLALSASLSELKERKAADPSASGDTFDGVLAALGGGGASTSTGSVSASTRVELLRLRMMRDALAVQSDPRDSFSPLSSSVSENLIYALTVYRNAAEGSSPELQTSSSNALAPEGTISDTGSVAPESVGPLSGSLEEIVDKASRRYGVAADLIKAVIKAESNFNPRAVSPAGACGLMQLMPGTAGDLGVTDSFDPEQNVMAGTRYLRQMLDRYDGNLDSALAAYNWGPGNVDKKGDFLPRETRQYLARVKSYYSDSVG